MAAETSCILLSGPKLSKPPGEAAMGAIRATAAAVLILFTAVAAMGECVTSARLISTRQTKPNLVSGPVAWSGSVLGVAKSQEDAATALWFAVYDEALQTLVPDRPIANDSRDIIGLRWTGTEFGLFYRTSTQRLHLQRLTMMGEPIGGPIPITPGRTVYSGDEIEVEWSPAVDAYIIARNISQGQFQGIWVTYVTRDGTQRSDRRLSVVAASQSNLSLAVTNAGVAGLVFTNQGNAISLARITESSPPISITVAPTAGNFIETAAVGNQFVITHAVMSGGKLKVHWLIVDTSHQVIRPDELLFEGLGDVWPVALVATQDELAMAYIDVKDRQQPLDKEYRLRRFTIDGTTITDSYFAASDLGAATRSESIYDFVWTGASYLQASFRRSPDRLNSHLLRYCPLRASVTTDVAFARPGQPIVFTAVPEGGTPGYSYEWTFGDPARVFRSQSVSRTYTETGTYTATLTVTDSAGSKFTTNYTVNVINASPLRASVITDVAFGRPGQPIVFTALPEGGTPGYSYEWTFGDATGIFRTQSVAHTYAQAGTYTATVKVTDSAGATFTTTPTIAVVNVRRRSTRH